MLERLSTPWQRLFRRIRRFGILNWASEATTTTAACRQSFLALGHHTGLETLTIYMMQGSAERVTVHSDK
jgi:hypothetical protein